MTALSTTGKRRPFMTVRRETRNQSHDGGLVFLHHRALARLTNRESQGQVSRGQRERQKRSRPSPTITSRKLRVHYLEELGLIRIRKSMHRRPIRIRRTRTAARQKPGGSDGGNRLFHQASFHQRGRGNDARYHTMTIRSAPRNVSKHPTQVCLVTSLETDQGRCPNSRMAKTKRKTILVLLEYQTRAFRFWTDFLS